MGPKKRTLHLDTNDIQDNKIEKTNDMHICIDEKNIDSETACVDSNKDKIQLLSLSSSHMDVFSSFCVNQKMYLVTQIESEFIKRIKTNEMHPPPIAKKRKVITSTSTSTSTKINNDSVDLVAKSLGSLHIDN
jgi:hypothetical protein